MQLLEELLIRKQPQVSLCIYILKTNTGEKKKGVAPQQRELLWCQMKKMKKNLFQTLVNKLSDTQVCYNRPVI